MSLFLFYGQRFTGAINSSIIMQVNPVFMVLLGIFIGERLTVNVIAGIGVSLLGTLLVMGVWGGQGLNLTLGQSGSDLLVLAGALCWAMYAVFSKGLVLRLGGYVATTWVMVAGALELLVLMWLVPVTHQWPVTPCHWVIIVYLAVFPSAVGFFAWYEGMQLIKLSLLNVMQYLTPVFTIILAWILLGERLSLWQWVGAGTVLAGVILVSRRGRAGDDKAVLGGDSAAFKDGST